MKLNNHTAIALLVVIELSVELIADTIEQTLSHLPWLYWWEAAHNYYVYDYVFCMTLMSIIITAIVLLDPKTIEYIAKGIWRKCQVFWLTKKHKRLKKISDKANQQ